MAAEVSALQVKALRDRTGLGFMQCKEALVEAKGDIEKAVDVLRQKGLKSADKKADRDTSQGRIGACVKGTRGVLVEVDCESDFVARNSDFVALVDRICRHVAEAAAAPASPEALLAQALDGGTVESLIKASVARSGENTRLKRFVRFDGPANGLIGTYVHPPGRIAVMVEAEGPGSPSVETALRDVCMHVAATNPVSVSADDIPAAVLEREKAVYLVQTHGKPPQVAEKMIQGKLQAFYAERCLLRQPFVKDPNVTVEKHLSAAAPGVKLRRFVRCEIGS